MSDEFDIQQAADTLKNWTRAYYREAALKREKAREEAKMLARRLLESDPTLKTVWGFGSVFEESRPFRPDSDIDLAIEGGDIFAAFRLVEGSEFKVDVVDITDCHDEFAERIRAQGVVLGQR